MIYAVSGMIKRTQKNKGTNSIFGLQKPTHLQHHDLQGESEDHHQLSGGDPLVRKSEKPKHSRNDLKCFSTYLQRRLR